MKQRRYHQHIQSFKERMGIKDSLLDKTADLLTRSFGTVGFLGLNALFFFVWVIINTGLTPFAIFDPYPFGFLTMVVSLEAIILSIIVLITQNRANSIADLRGEVDFDVNLESENEITRILNMLDEIHDHLGLGAKDDRELKNMKRKINIEDIRDDILKNK